jgi:hypothetical protein
MQTKPVKDLLGNPELENHTEAIKPKYLIFLFVFAVGCTQLQNLGLTLRNYV